MAPCGLSLVRQIENKDRREKQAWNIHLVGESTSGSYRGGLYGVLVVVKACEFVNDRRSVIIRGGDVKYLCPTPYLLLVLSYRQCTVESGEITGRVHLLASALEVRRISHRLTWFRSIIFNE